MMTATQARKLWHAMFQGKAVGADAEGNVVHLESKAAVIIDTIEPVSPYIARINSASPTKYETREAVRFLRGWADALEEAGK